MVTGFHHITLNVSDLERARRFYAALPGFVIDQDFGEASEPKQKHRAGEQDPSVPLARVAKLRFRIGEAGTRLVLVPPLPGTPEGDRFSEYRIGLDHLAIGVSSRDELESMLEVLRSVGADTDGIHMDRAGEVAMITFRDPDNIQWEFFEQPAT